MKDVIQQWADSNSKVLEPAKGSYVENPSDKVRADSIRHGYTLFSDPKGAASCIGCHTDYGRQVPFRYDDWGTLVRPMNLTIGVYRGGRRPIDIFWRIKGGIGPSGMPKTGLDNDKDIWDVVNFVQALPYPQMLPEDVRDEGLRPSRRTGGDGTGGEITSFSRDPKGSAGESVDVQKLWSVFFGVVLTAIFALCAVAPWVGWWLPQNVSSYGGDVDALFYIILAITGVAFVFTEVLLVWFMYQYAYNPNRRARYVEGNHRLELSGRWRRPPSCSTSPSRRSTSGRTSSTTAGCRSRR